ncbi:hypothetical protein HPB49_015720 [Dermacentor silvarum]|uniref:Uncharacterized protein n=1 Tax=Dermacentor silvarum TaxID=543639 RepID=A0ACB8CLK7_DERSI|nr:hypothetical protein HPB49_015720 [Dermacentor silvarum]
MPACPTSRPSGPASWSSTRSTGASVATWGRTTAGGVQRTISTGTLLPGSGPHSVDLVFATFWFRPTRVRAMSAEQRRCLELMRAHEAARFQVDSPLYGLDHDAFEQLAAAECGDDDEDNQLAYDPFEPAHGPDDRVSRAPAVRL